MPIESLPADFINKWVVYGNYFTQINWIAFIIALSTVIIILNFHRITTKVPGSIVVIFLSTTIIISGANHDVKQEMFKAQLYSIIDRHNILMNINDAIERAKDISVQRKEKQK